MVKCRILILIIFNLCLIVSEGTAKAGDTCIRPYDGRKGLYKPLWECKSLVKILKEIGIGFSPSLPKAGILCCVEPSVEENEEEEGERDKTTTPSMPVKRISEIKCEEYSKAVTLEVPIHFLGYHSSPKMYKQPNCDYGRSKNWRIFGGEPAKRGEFPHMAAIGETQYNGAIKCFCGGSLISEKFVLSAAHCFRSSVKVIADVVRLGDQNLNNIDDEANHFDFGIKQIIKHPRYVANKYDDIALIELKEPVILDKYIRPACLWTNDVIDAESAFATGWGATTYSNTKSDDLMKVNVNIFDNEQCESFYRYFLSKKFSGVKDTHICAGDLLGVRDACKGDSGGPLQIQGKENPCMFYVVGVINLGIGCATENVPALYARVSKYIDWIEEVVWNN